MNTQQIHMVEWKRISHVIHIMSNTQKAHFKLNAMRKMRTAHKLDE